MKRSAGRGRNNWLGRKKGRVSKGKRRVWVVSRHFRNCRRDAVEEKIIMWKTLEAKRGKLNEDNGPCLIDENFSPNKDRY